MEIPALVARALARDPNILGAPEPGASVDRQEMNLWMLRLLAGFSRRKGCGTDAEAPVAPARTEFAINVIYVIGVEGTGHHGVMPLLTYALLRRYGFSATHVWWRSLRNVFLPESVKHEGTSLYASPCGVDESVEERLQRRRAALAALLQPLVDRGEPCCILEYASFPWGTDRGRYGADTRFAENVPNRDEPHPGDSTNLDDWHALFGEWDCVDARYLVLRRNPVAAAWSHRHWDGSLERHGTTLAALDRYVADFLVHRRLCAGCAASFALPLCGDCEVGKRPVAWRWVGYGDFRRAKAGEYPGLLPALAAFCGVAADDLADALDHFSPSTKTPGCDGGVAAKIAAVSDAASPPGLYGPASHVANLGS